MIPTYWSDRISNHAQLDGIETAVMDNNLGCGTRIAWINTGAGLRYKVVIDRAVDIADAFYNQHHSLPWLSHLGITSPEPFSNRGIDGTGESNPFLYLYPGYQVNSFFN